MDRRGADDEEAVSIAHVISHGIARALKDNNEEMARQSQQLINATTDLMETTMRDFKAQIEVAQKDARDIYQAAQQHSQSMAAMQSTIPSMNTTGGGSSSGTMNTTISASKETASTTLSTCDGLAWKAFRSNFEIVQQLNGWNDVRAILKLRAAMREEAHRAIEHLNFSSGMTIQEALDMIEEIFINPSSIELAEAKFEAATREPGEALITWHIRLRELYARAYPQDKKLEESKRLKDKFILKCRDRALTIAIKSKDNYRAYRYTECLTKAQDHEATMQATSQHYEGGSRYHNKGVHQIEEINQDSDSQPTQELLGNMTDNAIQQLSAQFHRTEPFKLGNVKVGNQAKGACFHCGENGHMLRNCTLFTKAVERIRKNPGQFGLMLSLANSYRPRDNRPLPVDSNNGRGRGKGRGGWKKNNRNGKKPGMTKTIQEISAVECDDDYYDDVTTLTPENE